MQIVLSLTIIFLGVGKTRCHHLIVHHAERGHCNGQYALSSKSVSWAPDKPVYKHIGKARIGRSYKKLNECLTVFIERVIFLNAKGYGWSIGSTAFLVSGTHWHKSGLEVMNLKWKVGRKFNRGLLRGSNQSSGNHYYG